MPSLSEIKNRANVDYPDFPVDLEDGTSFNLKSTLRLDDSVRAKFEEIQKRVAESDDQNDGTSMKKAFIDLFCLIADDSPKARRVLKDFDLAEFVTLMKMYQEASSDSSKS